MELKYEVTIEGLKERPAESPVDGTFESRFEKAIENLLEDGFDAILDEAEFSVSVEEV
jgi:hypothetical protein